MTHLLIVEDEKRISSFLVKGFTTAGYTIASTVAGLEGGADDYVTKPFSFAELLARVRRRVATAAVARAVPADGPDWLAVDGLGLDLRTRKAHVSGAWVELSTREFDLLHALLAQTDTVLTREQLLQQVWGTAHDPGTNIVDVYIGYLRHKLDPARIQTVRGTGYRLQSRPAPGRQPRD